MNILSFKKIFITGGLGFIGYNIIKFFIKSKYKGEIVVFDNNSINNNNSLSYIKNIDNVNLFLGELLNFEKLCDAMLNSELVIHLAANSDISKGVYNPSVDFENTIVATQNVLNSMLKNNVSNIIYPSGSGVYGDVSHLSICEDYGPLIPVSHYGASKLSAESMISAFVHMHDLKALIFRFANVIGPSQTHGVAYDFIRKIIKDNSTLNVLGNGTQLKSYIHVDDIISGIFLACKKSRKKIEFYNLSTDDSISVSQIAELVIEKMETKTEINFGKTNYGWKGDVPKISISSNKILKQGWTRNYTTREAMEIAIDNMLEEISYKKVQVFNTEKK